MTHQSATSQEHAGVPLHKLDKIVIHVDPELADLIPLFLLNRQADVEAIRAALPQHDYALIQRLGHDMKGVGNAYGFEAITDLGACLERCAKLGDDAAIRRWVEELAAYLASVEVIAS